MIVGDSCRRLSSIDVDMALCAELASNAPMEQILMDKKNGTDQFATGRGERDDNVQAFSRQELRSPLILFACVMQLVDTSINALCQRRIRTQS